MVDLSQVTYHAATHYPCCAMFFFSFSVYMWEEGGEINRGREDQLNDTNIAGTQQHQPHDAEAITHASVLLSGHDGSSRVSGMFTWLQCLPIPIRKLSGLISLWMKFFLWTYSIRPIICWEKKRQVIATAACHFIYLTTVITIRS